MANVPEMIDVPNALKSKVSYGPDGVDAATIERAEQIIAGMQDQYLVWVQEDLRKIQAGYDKVRAMPVEDRKDSIRYVFDVAHDMKGQGGSFGFPLMTNVANNLCRFIETRPQFGNAEMDAIRVHIDVLRLIMAEGITGDGGPRGEKLMRGLELVVEKFAK